jgi:hypothetical protein
VEYAQKYAAVSDNVGTGWSGTRTTSGISNTFSGGDFYTYDAATDTWSESHTLNVDVSGCTYCPCSGDPQEQTFILRYRFSCASDGSLTSVLEYVAPTPTISGCVYTYSYGANGDLYKTITVRTLAEVQANAQARLDAQSWPALTSTTPVSASYAEESQDNTGYGCISYGVIYLAIRYRLRFKIPGVGTCYRVAWVERFIPEAGVGLTSLEIISRGVYRPAVTATGGGGSGCLLVAVMNSAGQVASVRVLNPGSGYTSAPTIAVAAATGGGTSSTGWTATVTDGRVVSVSGGTAGNYLPTLAFSGGGGSGATATVTMDETGGLASVTLTAAGSAYASAPALAITAKVASGVTAAVIHLHLGTETAKCEVWDKTVPSGYNPADSATWPTLPSAAPGYLEIAVPASEGTTTVANVRATCDCSTC